MPATTEILTHPYRVFRYRVDIQSITAGAFAQVSGFGLNVDVVEYRTGNASRSTMQKLPGLTHYGNVRLMITTIITKILKMIGSMIGVCNCCCLLYTSRCV